MPRRRCRACVTRSRAGKGRPTLRVIGSSRRWQRGWRSWRRQDRRELVLTSFRRRRSGRRVPLSAAHARDLDGLEQAGLAERFVARKVLRLIAARYVYDEAASRALDSVVAEQRPAKHEDIPVPVEIGDMLLPVS